MQIRKKMLGATAIGVSAVLAVSACSPPQDEGGAGGETSVTWIVNQPAGGWNHNAPEGGSVYLIQMVHGVLPSTGHWNPDSEWVWNSDLIVNTPELVEGDQISWEYQINPDAAWSDG
jgi:peptide/nickel transport system substrate-binding protein